MRRCLCRSIAAAVLWVAFTPAAGAESLAATVEQWGLLGSWAVDCAGRPDREGRALDLRDPEGRKGDVPAQFRRGQGRKRSGIGDGQRRRPAQCDGVLPCCSRRASSVCYSRSKAACAQSTIAVSAASTRSGTANTSRPARQHLHNSAAINPPEQAFRNLLRFLRNVPANAPFRFAFHWRRTS